MRYLFFVFSIFLFLPAKIFSESFNPVLNKKDIIFEKSDTGYDLYIRKLKEVNSILLTESQRFADPKINNYALRTKEYYEANSDEIRILDGKVLHTKYDAFFLVDSTPQNHSTLGEAFHFFLLRPDWKSPGYFLRIKESIGVWCFADLLPCIRKEATSI